MTDSGDDADDEDVCGERKGKVAKGTKKIMIMRGLWVRRGVIRRRKRIHERVPKVRTDAEEHRDILENEDYKDYHEESSSWALQGLDDNSSDGRASVGITATYE